MAKRTRQVFDTYRIGHLWAHQTQTSARNAQGSFSFDGPYLYSYTTVIATRILVEGNPVFLIAENHWSATTAKHLTNARSAAHGNGEAFAVAEWSIFANSDAHLDNIRSAHRANVDRWIKEAQEADNKAQHSPRRGTSLLSQAQNARDTAIRYCATFGLRWKIPTTKLTEAQRASIGVKSAENAQRTKEKRAIRSAEWSKRYAEQCEAHKREDEARAVKMAEAEKTALTSWSSGQALNEFERAFLRVQSGQGYALMRLVRDEVETTMGASVPVSHVRRALRYLTPLIGSGAYCSRPGGYGHSATFSIDPLPTRELPDVRLGHYYLDEICPAYTDSRTAALQGGYVRCGCHKFTFDEVQRIANVLESAEIIPATEELAV